MNAAEFATRQARARALMHRDALDALLLASGPNLYYFTGLPHGRSGTRPYVLLVTRAGETILLVHQARQFEARRFSSVAEVRAYAGLSRAPVREIADILGQTQIHRVGLEMGGEHYLDLQVSDVSDLRSALRGIEFVDAAPLLWELRKVKSAAEVAAIAQACAITADAYEATFATVRAGMTEAHIEAMMLAAMLARGGSAPWALITSGPGNYDLVSKGGGDRRVVRGDMVWMDAGCSVAGYNSDFSRAGVIGGPTEEALVAQSEVHRVTMGAVSLLRPGTQVATVAAWCEDALTSLTLPVTSSISGLAERVGHGLGLAVTEWPSLNRACPETLVPGMVVTVEPGVATHYGTFHVEQNVLVTEDGHRVLSAAPWQLRTLQE